MTQDNFIAPSCAEGAVHLLVALHAVSTRLALSEAERRRVDSPDEGVLEPGALWGHSCALFAEADEAGPGSVFDLGGAPLLLEWLGLSADEYHAEFGCSPSEALGMLVGNLRPLAHVVETLEPDSLPDVRHALARVWCRRVRVLADQRPRSLAATLAAVERALGCPPENDAIARSLLHCKAELAHLLGDEGTEQVARLAIDEVERRNPGHDFDGVIHETTARLVSLWWMAAHGRGLLASERELLTVAQGGKPLWSALCDALRKRRWDKVPVPIPNVAFHRDEDCRTTDRGVFVECLKASAASGVLDDILRVVELLLGQYVVPDPVTPGVAPVVSALVERRARLEDDWVAESGAPAQIWFELHQGARRPDTVARVELIRGTLHPLLARVGAVAPFAPVSLYIDRAAEADARGDFADERAALEVAVEFSRALPDRDQREHATVRLAALAWREGRLTEVDRLMGPLAGRQAAELRGRVHAAHSKRVALVEALERFERRPDLAHGARYAWAHQDAGHTVRALEVARALGVEFPGGGAPEAVLGGLLFEQGRCRSAAEALRSAVQSGFDPGLGEALLAQALGRIGEDGAAELDRLVRRSWGRNGIETASGRDVLAIGGTSGPGT